MSSTNATLSNSTASTVTVHDQISDKTCVVCFKIVDIFSIGECDHPVCYECSTRMRVLCQQNECPICRRLNQKVIFTSEISPYRELDQKNRSGLYDKNYRIVFTEQRGQNAFQRLLEHPCPKCPGLPPFTNHHALKDHLRRTHELFFCDICVEHLKIFSHERRPYNREGLATHRRKGDADNKSHRGHPLCEYCDERYLDRDELFRHLRKDHYFCHFCDADGSNHFYADHTSLREHFLEQHYLCEDGDCTENIFSAVFRTDIDLIAHKATVHGQNSKQARLLELNFHLAPRGRPAHSSRYEESDSIRSHSHNVSQSNSSGQARVIDARNEQEFPSLGNSTTAIPRQVVVNTRPFGTSGLARTKENFPALGGAHSLAPESSARQNPSKHETASALFQKNSNAAAAKKTKAQTAIATGTASKNNAGKSISHSGRDFPALSLGSHPKRPQSDLQSDFIATPVNMIAIAAKHRSLVPSYESSLMSSSSSASSSKINTIQRSAIEASAKSTNDIIPKINSTENFPALSDGAAGGGKAGSLPLWITPATTKSKKQPPQSRKDKVAPHPLLDQNESKKKSKATAGEQPAKSNDNSKNKQKEKAPKEQASGKTKKEDNFELAKTTNKPKETKKPKKSEEPGEQMVVHQENGRAKKKSEIQKNEGNSAKKKSGKENFGDLTHNIQNNSNANESLTNGNSNLYASVTAIPPPPPPGFATPSKAKNPPPGFNTKPKYSYIPPVNAAQRNQILVSHFQKTLKNPLAMEEFIKVSQLYREGSCHAQAYYEHCQIILGEKFDKIFPELLILLPEITKQQELYFVYIQNHPTAETELRNSIQMCDLCKQIVKRNDMTDHAQRHVNESLNKDFPKLNLGALIKK